ncbi:hypothetical protein BDV12DRAFT_167697 [Aspergillus spectabilis]
MQQQPQRVQGTDPLILLDSCKRLNEELKQLKNKRETTLAAAQNAVLQSNNSSEDKAANDQLENIKAELNNAFLKLKEDFAKIKNTPGSGDSSVQNQIEHQGRRLAGEIQEFQNSMKEFRQRLREQLRRRIQIAEPDATPEQVEESLENVLSGSAQVFQVSGARTQRGRDVADAVSKRSEQIKKIEVDITLLHTLVQEVLELVMQQEPAVQQIDQGAENVARDLENANTQLGQAVVSARKARRWKWYALIIVIIIIAIIVAVAVGVTQS